MQVEIKIDSSCTEPKIIIHTASITEEVNTLMQRLSENAPPILTGSKDGKMEVLEPDDLFRIYAANGKVFAVTDKGEYLLRLRLYEAAERLNPSLFVRISNSEIIHIKKVKKLRLEFQRHDLCGTDERYDNLCFQTLCLKNQKNIRNVRYKTC